MAPQTITGTLTVLPNPCTTRPCLPGTALAVVGDNNVRYFLTRGGRFYAGETSEENGMPAPGEPVVASGSVQEQHDIAGNTFTTIEVATLQPK